QDPADLGRVAPARAPDAVCPRPTRSRTKPPLPGTDPRRGRPCGLLFQVRGSRQVRAYAVRAGAEDRILFYDGTGERFGETGRGDAPDPRRLAAREWVGGRHTIAATRPMPPCAFSAGQAARESRGGGSWASGGSLSIRGGRPWGGKRQGVSRCSGVEGGALWSG